MDFTAALAEIADQKAGFLAGLFTQIELDALISAWRRLVALPDLRNEDGFIVDPRIYGEAAFAGVASHPVVEEAVRCVIGECRVVRMLLIATHPNATAPSRLDNLDGFHVEHPLHSDRHPLLSEDTSAWAWVNLEPMAVEDGPLALSLGSHHIDLRRQRLDPAQVLQRTRLHVGAGGATAIFSGKTLHTATNNCGGRVRKGISIGYVPAEPRDVTKRGSLDLCHQTRDVYERFAALLGRPERLERHRGVGA
jgi:hypothetical protein